MADWPVLPDEADEIPDELALRVGKAVLVKACLERRWLRVLARQCHHSQEWLDIATPFDDSLVAERETLKMALEALDDGR